MADYITSSRAFFQSDNSKIFNNNGLVRLHTSYDETNVNIICHLNESIYKEGNINSLMTPQMGKKETIYQIGPVTWGILKDLGWTMNSSIFVTAPKNGSSYVVNDSLEIEWFDVNEGGTPIYKIDLYNQEGNLVTNFTPAISGKFGTNSIKLAITSDIPSNVNIKLNWLPMVVIVIIMTDIFKYKTLFNLHRLFHLRESMSKTQA